MRKNLHGSRFILISLLFLIKISITPFNLYSQTGSLNIYRDDFNRDALGTFWEAAPSWSIVDNAAFNFIDGVGGTLTTSKSYPDSSYVIETSAKGFNLNYDRKFAITFGQANLNNDSMYEVLYTAYGGGRLTLYRSTDNVYYGEKLDEVAFYPMLGSTQWYNFKIARYKSGLIQVYIDEGSGYSKTPLLEAIDTLYPELNHAGWRVDTETIPESFYVDWMAADKPAIEKPAIKEKPAEDDLITQVSATSGRPYKVDKLTKGVKAFTDRDYTITSFPDYLSGASFIQTAMDDKSDTGDNFLTSFLKKDAVVYIAYDPRATQVPEWLSGWTKTGDRIGTTDPGSDYLDIYSKLVEYGNIYPFPLLLGGNLASPASGAKMNYMVVAIERPDIMPLQAEDAALSGAVVANDHINYLGTGFVDFINRSDDYIEWTVNISVPGIYSLGFQYGNASHIDRPLDIADNGIVIGTMPFSPLSTSWDSWGFAEGPKIFLSSGVHKIRATATGSSGPNMDQLSLSYISSGNINHSRPDFVSAEQPALNIFDKTFKAYPNPFSQATNIYFSIKEKSRVTLSVYSLQGQQLQLLVNDFREAGEYKVNVDGSKFAPGIYFYRLQTGNQTKVGKIIKQ